jgi:hypothetical protein
MKKNNSRPIVRSILTVIFLFSVTTLTHGQQTKRTSSIEAGGGVCTYGIMFYGAYVAPLGRAENSHLFLKPSLFYEKGSGKNVKYNTLGADLATGYTILSISSWMILNAKIGFTISHDKLTTPLAETQAGGSTIQNDHKLLKFGALGGVEVQWLLSQKLSITTGADQRYLIGNNTWGHMRWYAYTGLRYAIR